MVISASRINQGKEQKSHGVRPWLREKEKGHGQERTVAETNEKLAYRRTGALRGRAQIPLAASVRMQEEMLFTMKCASFL
jgi:hypothetical protein